MDDSLATLRRDLQRQEEQGGNTRSYDGAAIGKASGTELTFLVRKSHGPVVKRIFTYDTLSDPWRNRLQQMDVRVTLAAAGPSGADDADA